MRAMMLAMLHPAGPVTARELWFAWTLEPFVILTTIAGAVLYASGVRRVWRSAGPGRGVRRWQAACFAAGIVLLVVALIGPLDALGGVLFAGHMTQHMVLMSVAAPLIVLGAPQTAVTWALPRHGRRRVARALGTPAVRVAWRALTAPAVAWLVHAAAIWIWHIPALYAATVTSDLVHSIQHTCFMVAALLFWWALRDRATHGLAVLYLFTTAVHTSILGALLAFAPAAWYAPYEQTAPLWGLTPLEDQQLGGFIMWVPGGTIYFVAALALLGLWMQRSGRRAERLPGLEGVAEPASSARPVPVSKPASPATPAPLTRPTSLVIMLAAAALLAGCRSEEVRRFRMAGTDPERGRAAFTAYGCGACHEIRGVRGADGRVGPPLTGMRSRVYIAGHLPNEGANVAAFIMDPPAWRNPTAMPALGVTEQEARDITAWLYSLD